jgi:sulfatase modifying factor 1
MSFLRLLCLTLGITLLVLFTSCDKSDDTEEPAGNSAPNQPSNPVPANQATGQSTEVNLAWTCSDPDSDPLTYDVCFGTASNPPQVNSGQASAGYDPGTLANSQTYYWKITAHDNHDYATAGPTWSFTTTSGGVVEEMVLIPAGPYDMGADYDAPWSLPIHTVTVPAFYMDIYEVTNAKYKAFCDATSRAYPDDYGFIGMPNYFTNIDYVNYPVVMVSWDDARAYAAWAGKRLPTEAEWERAAKGNADNRQWPWGDTWVAANANTSDNPADGYPYTSPVGSYPNGVSPAGCYDMSGNVWEWCEDDWHDNYIGAPTDGGAWVDNPSGSFRAGRDGSWSYYGGAIARCANRTYNDPSSRHGRIGFRCAKTP